MVKTIETIAITGASGFIGKHLLAILRQRGDARIKILTHSKGQNSGFLDFGAHVEFFEADLNLPDSLNNFLEPGCTVLHLAYLHGASGDINLNATSNLLQACRVVGIRRFILCSTAAVFGRVSSNLISEDERCNPVSEYGITKLKIENAVCNACAGFFDAVILRPTSVVGPHGASLNRLADDLVARKNIRNYLKRCLFNRRQLNLVNVENVVAAIIFLIEYQNNFSGDIYIVSEDDVAGNNFSDVEKFIKQNLELEASRLPVIFLPLWLLSFILKILGRNNINPICKYDSSKLLGLGFRRPLEFEDGIKKYTDWYKFANKSNMAGN